MLSPDLGGGRRLRRRPGSFFTGFLLLVLLFSSSLPSSTPGKAVSGESDFSIWARHFAPPDLMASSTVRAPSHSLLASAGGNFRPVVLHSYLFSCLTGSIGFRSEVTEILMRVSNTRSNLSLSRSLRLVSGSDRLCSSLCKSEKLASEFISPLVVWAKSSCFFNPTGDCNFSCCYSRKERYNIITPIVSNLYSKFNVDFGVLHGLIPVMIIVYISPEVCSQRIALSWYCGFHHFAFEHYHQWVAVFPERFDSAIYLRIYFDDQNVHWHYSLVTQLLRTVLFHGFKSSVCHQSFVDVRVVAADDFYYLLGRTPTLNVGLVDLQSLKYLGREPISFIYLPTNTQVQKGFMDKILAYGFYLLGYGLGIVRYLFSFHPFSHLVQRVLSVYVVFGSISPVLIA